MYFSQYTFFSDDVSPQKTFNSGIVHCATNCVIHNIDLHESLGCDCDKIRTVVKPPTSTETTARLSKYDCHKNNYSSNTSCGTIFLKDAIEKIQEYNTASSLLSISSISPSKSHSRKIPQKSKLKRHHSVIGNISPVVPIASKTNTV